MVEEIQGLPCHYRTNSRGIKICAAQYLKVLLFRRELSDQFSFPGWWPQAPPESTGVFWDATELHTKSTTS